MDFISENNRIYATDESGKLLAEVTFPDVDTAKVEINHTFVDESLRGQGVASKLIKLAYNQIKKQNKKAVPTCSYAVRWFDFHKDYQDILTD